MKKKLITLACFLLTVGLVTGCGLTNSTSPSSESSSSSGSEPISTSSEGPDSSSTSHYSSDSSSGRSEDISSSIMPDPSSSITPEPISSSSETPTPVSSSEKPEPSSSSEKPTPSSSSITPTPSSSSITPEPSSSSITPSPSSSSIAPIHTHECVKIDGKAPTCTEDGWNDYWKCEDCGKFFTTEDATQEITDLETWKVGAGKLEAKGHKYEDTLSYASGVGKVVSTCSVCKDTKVTELGAPKTITGLLAVDEVAKLAEAEEGVSENYYCYKGRLTELALYETSFNGVLSDGTSSFNLYKLVNSTGHDLVVGADLVVISKIKGYYGGVENSEGEALDLSLKESVVTVSKGEGYSTSIDDKTKAIIGDVITFTVTTQTGYFVTKVTCNGEKLNIENDGKYNVAVISEETNIEVTVSKSRPAEKAWVAAPNFAPVDGKKFLFTYESGETRKELSGINTSKSTHYGDVADITGEDPAGLFPIRMQKNTEDDTWLLCVDVTGNEKTVTKYLSCTNTNTLKLTEGPFSWTWDEKAGFSASFNDTTRSIQYNSSSPRFAAYSSTQQKAQYYIENQTCTHASVTHHDAVAATCTVNGNKEYWTCNDCGAFFLDAEHTVEVNYFDDIFVKGEHHFDETKWESDGKGEFHYHVCSVCGEKQEESKTACTLKHVDALAPTCTEEGHGAYDYCEVCGYESEHEEHIAPLGHLNVHQVEKQDPTCVAEGHEAYWVCDREEGCCYEEYDSQTGKLTGPFDPTIEIDPENHDLHTVWNEEDTKAESTHTTSCFREGCTYTPVTEPCSFTKDDSKSYPATESADGNIHWVCSKCEAEYDEVIPKVTHAKDVDNGITYDTETKSWIHSYTCHGGENCPSYTTQPHTGHDEIFTEVEGNVVASITDENGVIHGYTSFVDAVTASVTDDVIKVEAEIKLIEELVINADGKELTFDLNDHVITTAESYDGYYMIKVIAGTVTFIDSGNDGAILAREGTDNIPLTAYANGHIIINSGIYGGQLNSSAVYVTYGNDAVPGNTADLVVNGGHFIFVDPESEPIPGYNIVNINIRNDYDLSHITVNGGTFSADPSTGDDTFNGNYVSEGLCVAPVKGEFVVGSFEDLLANDNVDTINIVHDISIATEQFIDHDLTINLLGHVITSTQATGRLFTVHKGAHLEINGQPLVDGDTSAVIGTIRVGKANDDNGSLTINGGTYTSLEGKKQAAIQSNGTCTDCDIEINSATVKSVDDIAVYIGGGGDVTINDSFVEGDTGLYAKAGNIIISGTTIGATGTCVPISGNNNGANTNGNAIVLDSSDNYNGGDITLFVEGSVITSDHGYGIVEVVSSGTKSKVKSITLGDPDEEPGIIQSVLFLTELSPVVLSDKFEGTIEFNDTNVVAALTKANKVTYYYQDFVDAVNESENGDTVSNIVNVDTEETIVINKSITIHFSETYNYTKESVSASAANLQYAFVITGSTTKVTFVIDNEVTSASAFVGIYEGAELTMNESEGKQGAITSYYRVARVDSSTLIINNLDLVTECETGADATITLFGSSSTSASLTVDNAKVYNYGANSCITSNGNNAGDDSNATLTNSTFVSGTVDENGDYVSGGDVAIYWPCGGALTMTNCVASGLTGLYVKGGTVNITTSTFLGHGNYTGYKYSGGGCNATGDAIVVDNCNYPNTIKEFVIDAKSYKNSSSEKGSVIASYAHGANTYEYDVVVAGEIHEYTSTYTAKNWVTSSTSDSTWKGTLEGGYSNNGVQITTSYTGVVVTSDKFYSDVTSIVLTYCTNKNDGVGSVEFKVGDVSVGSQNVVVPKDEGSTPRTLTYDLESRLSGNISFTVTCTKNSIYIISVKIICGGNINITGARTELKATIDAYDLFETEYATAVEVDLPSAPAGFAYTWKLNDAVIESNHLSIPQDETLNKEYTVKLIAVDSKDSSFTYERTFETFTVKHSFNYGTLEQPLTSDQALTLANEQCESEGDFTYQKVYVSGVIQDDPEEKTTYYQKFNVKTPGCKNSIYVYSANLGTGITGKLVKNAEVTLHGFFTRHSSGIQMNKNGGDYVYVEKLYVAATNIAIDEKPVSGSFELAVGGNATFTAVIAPTEATNKDVTWTIASGADYVSLLDNEDGTCKLTGVAAGNVTLAVKSNDNDSLTDSVSIVVKAPVIATGIAVTASKSSIELDETVVFTAEVTPSTAKQEVIWSLDSESEGLAEIVSTTELTVTVKAIDVGDIKVIATTKDGSELSANCTVTATYPTAKFVEVNSTDDLTDGKYLIAYVNGSNAYVFNGLDVANGHVLGTYSSTIVYDNALAQNAVEIKRLNSGDNDYSIQVLTGTNANKYISGTSGNNTIKFDDSPQTVSISFTSGNPSLISNTTSFTFNSASGNLRFRFYKSGSGQQPVKLFKVFEPEVPLKGLSFSETSKSETAGTPIDLNDLLVFNPTQTSETDVTWTSNNENVTVTDGVVTATSAQTATITATSVAKPDISASIVVTFEAAPSYAVTINCGTNGSIVVKNGDTVVNSGDTVLDGTKLTIEVSPAEGYTLDTLTANGEDIASNKEFTVSGAAVTIAATFKAAATAFSVLDFSILTANDCSKGSELTDTNCGKAANKGTVLSTIKKTMSNNSSLLSSVTASKIYNGNSSSGWKQDVGFLKTGGGSSSGTLTLTFDSSVSISKVVVSAHTWTTDSSDTVSVNNSTEQTASKDANNYGELIFEITASNSITILCKNRCFINYIELY